MNRNRGVRGSPRTLVCSRRIRYGGVDLYGDIFADSAENPRTPSLSSSALATARRRRELSASPFHSLAF